jgi:cell division protein FtsW (lipid II flippase)
MTTAPAYDAEPGVTPAQFGRRGTELGLLVFAVAVATAAQAAVVFAHDERITTEIGWYALGFLALYGSAHLAVRWLAPAADPLLLPFVALLNGLGLAMIYRLDLADADRARRLGRAVPAGDAPLQLVWSGVGVLAFVAVLLVIRDHRVLARYSYTFALVGLVLLLLPALPGIGTTINGARLWLRIGPLTFQPSEVAKLALIVFFAGYLVAKRDVLSLAGRSALGISLPRARDLGPVLLAWLASVAVLVRERDLGSSLLFFGIFVVMLYVATERTSWLLIGVALFAGGTVLAYQLFGHVRERVDIWLNPFRDPTGDGYQLVQSLFGFATGGVAGTGLGRGRPDTVPFANTDFILASLGEELGLVGVMAVLLVYGLLVTRGLRTALGVRDPFGKLLAVGLSFSFALQVFVTAGGVMRLIPLTGLTMPFVSYGGSSLVANAALVALLLRISDAARRPTPPVPPPLIDPALAGVAREMPTQGVPVRDGPA